MPDTQEVYAAEDLFRGWLDEAHRSPGDPVRVRVGGELREFAPETEVRFTDPDHVEAFVDKVLAHVVASQSVYDDGTGLDLATVPVSVRARRGHRLAHYERHELPLRGVIAIPPREIGGSWSLRAAVVLHEIAHHLCSDDGHGREFRTTFLRLLEDLGMPVLADMLHTAYRVSGLDTGVDDEDRTLLRIGRLLRQAERSSNEAERDAFFAKAQALATRHQIALAVARATATDEERREDPTWETVLIGESGKRSLARYVRLVLEIARANDVRVAIYTTNTRVTLYGFPSDISIVKALYASLVTQMVTDADAHLRSGAHRADTRLVWNARRRRWEERPVHGSTARAAFYEAWADHVGERLFAARRETQAAVIEAESPSSSSTELALRAKEVEVVDYFAQMQAEHGVRGTWKGAASAGHAAPGSHHAGVRAAARARLGTERALE
ncbi:MULTISPECIES: TIGR04338 family metallohydrolase [Nocardioides]|uniref:TIGR04338 family metallohydrolase n=1 Tax=Nocardioides vastitatis TaxID=2568655 RepID=A0ABW0ZNH4_9ACTN|nr:TIGR04338 family metallohydrolase [Nocardioides sp.]THI96615.1 TIGR04338 family metallohydrolase [Nocardioides sp.]